ncbi:MAG: hypothetical protein KIT27_10855 [Legionellales bacterium]|nr:hypothetical protein [Legionellales bacterium]
MTIDKNIDAFIKNLQGFEYKIQSVDRQWNIIFMDKKAKWHHLFVNKYQDTYYLNLLDNDIRGLEVKPHQSVTLMESFGFSHDYRPEEKLLVIWEELIIDACRWLNCVKKDWIKINKQIQENYPLNRRKGIVPNSIVRESLSDCYRIDKALGKANTKKFIDIVESNYLHRSENTEIKSMSAHDYFNYCKIAYTAVLGNENSFDKNLSGKQLYKCYADGRDEGLLSIKEKSKVEFEQWLDGKHPLRESGGHPWEIMRGGNTTHIDLIVERPSYYFKEGFKVVLNGPAISRLKDTICMFLAIYDAGLPITINDFEGIRKRLLGHDNIGIIPCYDSLHRANQTFYEHESVYDVCYFDDFGRYKNRIKSFTVWEPLPILKPIHVPKTSKTSKKSNLDKG